MTDASWENRRTGRHGRVFRERLTLFAACLAGLIAWFGAYRDTGTRGGSTDEADLEAFCAQKCAWRGRADTVLAGDSRVYQGASPSMMQAVLGQGRVLNFGFSAVGYGQEYLAAVEGVLDPAAPRKRIVLGINPHSLTRAACLKNGFIAARRPTDFRERLETFLAGLGGRYSRPVPLRDPDAALAELRLPNNHRRIAHLSEPQEDGWVASTRNPETPNACVADSRRILRVNPIDNATVGRLLDAVRRWRAAGIRVYAFRPPTTAEMLAAEQVCAGYDEAALAEAFEAAGGRWIDMDQTAYHSYDGSHLTRTAAEQMSRDLARAIRLKEAGVLAAQ